MNEAKHLLELKMLYQICAEQIIIILTAETKAERDNAEEYHTSAFHCILKLIKSNVLPLQEEPVSEAVTGKANVQNTSILCER